MDGDEFRFAVAIAGAAITVASAAISGLRAHGVLARHVPWLRGLAMRDAAVIAGALVGIVMVAQWLF